MENKERKFKFPIGAIFMLVYVVLNLVQKIPNIAYVPLNTWFYIIVCVAIAVFIFMKKRGLPILVSFGALALIELRSLLGDLELVRLEYVEKPGIFYILIPLISIVAYACVAVLSLEGMNVDKIKKYKNILTTLVIALPILKIVLVIINESPIAYYLGITDNFYSYIHVITKVSFCVSIILIGLWVANPYVADKTESNCQNGVQSYTEYYVSLGKHICLLLFTCGIWQFIWIYKSTKFTNFAKNEEERNPGSKLLLCMFVPFYMIYWTYKTALRIDSIAKEKGLQSDLGTICLILAIFIGIVPPVLMQEKINQCILASDEEKREEKQNDEVNTIEALEKYKELLDKGIITQEEFNAKKKQILGL